MSVQRTICSPPSTTLAPSLSTAKPSCKAEALRQTETGDRRTRSGVAVKWTRTPTPPTTEPSPRDEGTTSAVSCTAVDGGGAYGNPVEGEAANLLKGGGDGASALEREPTLWAAAAATAPTAPKAGTTVAETSASARAQPMSTAPLSGSFANGGMPGFGAALEIGGPIAQMPFTPRQRHEVQQGDGFSAGSTSAAKNVLVSRHLPTDSSSGTSRLKSVISTSSIGTSAAAAAVDSTTAPTSRAASPWLTASESLEPEVDCRLESDASEQRLGIKPKEIELRLGLGDEASGAEATSHSQLTRPLEGDLNSEETIRVPEAPPCKPPSWENAHSVLTIRPCRPGAKAVAAAAAAAVAAAAPGRRKRRPLRWTPVSLNGGSGAGAAAVAATKDVHNVLPAISIPHAIIRPRLVEDMFSLVRSPVSPAPPLTRGRAAGDASPLRIGSSDSPPRSAAQEREWTRPSLKSSCAPLSSFFPVRPRASRCTPVSSRGRQRTVSQSRGTTRWAGCSGGAEQSLAMGDRSRLERSPWGGGVGWGDLSSKGFFTAVIPSARVPSTTTTSESGREK